MISGTITLFLILSTLIVTVFSLSSRNSLLIQAILEMTTSIAKLSLFNINDIFKVVFATMIISFGGLSIHLQVISSLDDKIRYKNYFIGRIYQTIISGIISFLLMFIM